MRTIRFCARQQNQLTVFVLLLTSVFFAHAFSKSRDHSFITKTNRFVNLKVLRRFLHLSTQTFMMASSTSLSSSAELESSLLACQRSAYLKQSSSKVLKCEYLPVSNSYRVILDNSILYPEGGGQPSDQGTVNGLNVLKVSKPTDAGEIATFPEEARSTCVEIELPSPVDVDSMVDCVIDWDRRYDFMQQHTAQHLFSAIADKLYKADTVGWALGADSVTVDLASNPLLTPEQLQHVEDETNAYIAQGLPVSWSVHGREDLEQVMDSDDCFRGMVKGAASNLTSLRLVRISGLDLNPCGGTHLQNLAEINVLKIIGTEKDRKSLRVRFVAGQRALQYFRQCVQRETILSQKFSAPPTEHTKLLDKLLNDRKDLEKKNDLAQEEIAGYYGQELLRQINQAGVNGGSLVLFRHRHQGSLKFLLKVAAVVFEELPRLRASNPSTCLPDVVVLYITGGDVIDEESPEYLAAAQAASKTGKKPAAKKASPGSSSAAAVDSPSYPFVLATSEGAWLSEERKASILALLEAKGGGRPGLLQGQSAKVLSARNEVVEALRK